MKPRSDYEHSLWRRLVRFVDGETLEDVEKRAEELRESSAQRQEDADVTAEQVLEQEDKGDKEEKKRLMEEARA
ncbi:MAG: hypothetical protein ACI4QX_05485, partial [Lachnospiraceae bacterium]